MNASLRSFLLLVARAITPSPLFMRHFRSSLLLFAGLGLAAADSRATFWTGATSTDWNTAGNWNPTGVPSATWVTVNSATSARWPVFNTQNAQIQSLDVGAASSTAQLLVGGGKTLTVDTTCWIGNGGTADVTVNGGTLYSSSSFVLGGSGSQGNLLVNNGGVLRTSVSYIGSSSSSVGTLKIDGINSLWETHGSTQFGVGGTAVVTLSNKGELRGGWVEFAFQSAATLNLGAAANGTPVPGGRVNVSEFRGGTGVGTIQFNTNSSDTDPYYFTSDASGYGTGPAITGNVNVINTYGTAVLMGANTYTGTTTINNGTLQIGNDGPDGRLGTGEVINNSQLTFRLGGDLLVSAPISGTGSVKVRNYGGTVTFSGANTYSGQTVVPYGGLRITGSLSASSSGSVTLDHEGILSGDGTIGRPVDNSGTLAPGASLGVLSVTAPVTLHSSSTTIFEIGGTTRGTGYDGLNVDSLAADGTFKVTFVNGYIPQDGDTFDLIQFSSLTGTFATLDLPDLGSSLGWDTTQLYTEGKISIHISDITPPAVASIAPADATPTAASAAVRYTVTFSEDVTGVDAADFRLTESGVTGSAITGVTGSGSTYTVAVTLGTGLGTIRLDLVDDDSIADAAGNKLGGTGSANGNFSSGDVYTTVAPPSITSTLTASGTYGSTFLAYAITANGSPTSYSATGLPAGLTISASTGQITGTPTTTVGSPFSVTIGARNGGGTGSATLVITINRRPLLISSVTASSKVYDGTAVATLNTSSASLTNKLSGDTLTLDTSGASGTFASRAVGNGKTVTTSGFAISGVHAADYNLSQPTTTASITVKALSATGLTATGRVYDGTTAVALSGTAGLLAAETAGAGATNDGKPYDVDAVSVTGTPVGAFVDRHVGSDKAVSVTGLSLAGAQAGNYTLTPPSGLSATVTAKALTPAGLTGVSRNYDGTVAASVTGTATLPSAVAPGTNAPGAPYTGDTVSIAGTPTATFASKVAGSAKPISVAGLSLQGAQSGNYTLSAPTGITGNINRAHVSVAGVAVASKTYDGSPSADLALADARLSGVANGDNVILMTSGASGQFFDANAGTNKTITVTGLSLGGTDAANYTLDSLTLAGDIDPASATISFSGLTQTYNGSPRPVVASTTPSGLGVTITYDGSASVPVNAGTYAVSATISGTNYVGTNTASLTVARAAQTVTIASPATPAVIGTPIPLTASATSGLPVTLSIVSGPGSLSGSSVTLGATGSVVVRATQAGNANYESAFKEITLTVAAKQPQTIDFGALPNRRANEAAFPLSATASSGLPVSFSIVSGPAVISGSTLTLTGASGAVVVRASQPGNAAYNPAPDVDQAFNVIGADDHQVFFGLTQNDDTLAIDLAPDNKSGVLLVMLSQTGEAFIVTFVLNADGTFDATVTPFSVNSASTADDDVDGRRIAAAQVTRTFHGKLNGGIFSGTIVDLGISFSATLQLPTGPTADLAGLYQSSALNSASGSTTSIVGSQGQVLVIATTPAGVVGGNGAIAADGSFNVKGAGGSIIGSVDAPTTSVSGTVVVPNQPAIPFSGLGSGTLRTDRMINLSSRARIGPDDPHTLITGFVIGGAESKRLLLRAIGPALARFGVGDALADPRLELYNAQGQLVLANDNWSGADTADAMARTGAFSLPAGSKDAAVLVTLVPGSYTMHVKDGGQTGVTLAEIYDASANPQGEYQRMINISSRGFVDSGDGILVGGFVVTGNSPKRVLIRGAGPALAKYGVAGALSDPRLAIYDGATRVAQNDDWTRPTPMGAAQVAAPGAEITAAGKSVGAFDFDANSKDAAVIVTLAPGAYTAQVSAAGGTTGTALVEIYELP